MKTTPSSKFLQGYSELLALLTKNELLNQPVFIGPEVLIAQLAQRAQLAQLKGRRNWLNWLNLKGGSTGSTGSTSLAGGSDINGG